MRTARSQRAHAAKRRRQDRIYAFDRYVDASVILRVVRADPKGDIVTPNGQRVTEIRRHHLGGVFDTKASPVRLMPGRWYGPHAKPRMWLCSEDQEPLVLHGDDSPRAAVVVGSMGAGKTTALAMWHFIRWIENCCEAREGGQTAPTLSRLGLVRAEIDKLWRPSWKRWTDRPDFTGYELCDGTKIRFRHTHQQSVAAGSPIQGFNWSWCGRDEMQDQIEVHEDIEARGRAAKRGGEYFKQLGTATAKDDPEWRTLRDRLAAARDEAGRSLWTLTQLLGKRSPFISATYWERLKATMSERLYAMIVDCEDRGPELATYSEWSREKNLIIVPEIGWVDVTEYELRGSGNGHDMLVGHDPGALWYVSLLAKAYVRNQNAYARGVERPFWVIRGEVNDEQATTRAHIEHLLNVVRDRWQLNLLTPQGRPNQQGRRILVRADPADMVDRENAGTHKTVYTQFANAGIHIKPAAYNAENDGHGKVPKDPGIEVIKTLICDTNKDRRLFVEKLPDGTIVAPKLVDAIESCQRDHRGQAEAVRKGPNDKSHWTAALRYMMWAIERPRLQAMASRNA
jgi:hypothetical protein